MSIWLTTLTRLISRRGNCCIFLLLFLSRVPLSVWILCRDDDEDDTLFSRGGALFLVEEEEEEAMEDWLAVRVLGVGVLGVVAPLPLRAMMPDSRVGFWKKAFLGQGGVF